MILFYKHFISGNQLFNDVEQRHESAIGDTTRSRFIERKSRGKDPTYIAQLQGKYLRVRGDVVDLFLHSKAADTIDMVEALKTAVDAGQFEILCQLFRDGARVYYEWRDRSNNYHSYSPLVGAVEREDTAMIDFLLCKKAPVGKQGYEHTYPIAVAARKGNGRIVRRLLERGAKAETWTGSRTTLYFA